MAKRFFNNNPLPAVPVTVMQQSGVMHLLDDLAKLAGQGGQIKQKVLPQRRAAERGQPCFEFFIGRHVGEVALAINKLAENSCQTFSSTGLVRENWSSAARNSFRHDSSVFSRRAKPTMRNADGICFSLQRW